MAVSNALPLGEGAQTLSLDPTMMGILGESSLADFLNDVMSPLLPAPDGQPVADRQTNQGFTQRDFLDFGTSWDEFGEIEAMLSGHDVRIHHQSNNTFFDPQVPRSGTKTPMFGESFGVRNAAFSRSIWRWIPTKKDRTSADQLNLSLPYSDIESPKVRYMAYTLSPNQRIDQPLRDKLLALILTTCDIAIYPEIVAAFPSTELLNGLMHYSLTMHFNQIDSWIHVPSLVIEQNLELLISIIAAGAVTNSVPAIRKLGFALLESARSALYIKV